MCNIIGISAYYHDAACCLLTDGVLTAAAEEERFTRVKHDPSLPVEAFRYCLDRAGLTVADVDCIGYYEQPTKKLSRQLWMEFPKIPSDGAAMRRLDPKRPEHEIRDLLGYEGPILYMDHHQSHAASGYYFSGFDDSAILTVDGVGEWATTTYGHGRGDEIEIFEEVRFPHSLGLLYSTITSYLGFEVNEGEYKVMGLAPYGEPIYTDQIRSLIESTGEGAYTLNLRYFDFLRQKRMYSDELPQLFGHPVRQPDDELRKCHEDIARSLQVVLEEMLLEKAEYLHHRTGSRHLCMAGGVALNCVANARVLRDGPFTRLFVQPAASDAGGSLGAAALAYKQVTGRVPSRERLSHVYLGPDFPATEIQQMLDATPLDDVRRCDDESRLIEETVDRLADGKVVGWFHGRMEFGPRALGARSILADPRVPDMRDRINALVKQREAFRPFAPTVREERASDHFELDHPSPFMLETAQVRSGLSLPSITHVDGSARVQTVDGRTNPRFARLLDAFERRTGCPILLNTSFNVRGEPIVCTPFDALLCFVNCGIDTLVLEDFIIDRAAIPGSWPALFARLRPTRASAVGHAVYTLV